VRQSLQLDLKRLQRQVGTTFIFVTHDQEEALTISDRIALMRDGRIEQCAGAQEIYDQPATAFAAQFIGQTNLLEAELIERDGGFVRCRLPGGLELRVRAANWPAGVARAAVSIRPEKLHLSKSPLTVENVFQARVAESFFKGASQRFLLVTDRETQFTSISTNESAHREPVRAGDRVWCAVHVDDVVVVLP
jgi:spermidine/putrescine transport system ATP-binding protein